jgi:hypothetical protein
MSFYFQRPQDFKTRNDVVGIPNADTIVSAFGSVRFFDWVCGLFIPRDYLFPITQSWKSLNPINGKAFLNTTKNNPSVKNQGSENKKADDNQSSALKNYIKRIKKSAFTVACLASHLM